MTKTKEDIIAKFDSLILDCTELRSLAIKSQTAELQVKSGKFKTTGLDFLASIFERTHEFYVHFAFALKDLSPYSLNECLGILQGARSVIAEGWLIDIKALLSYEIFSDFLEMAEYLLSEKYKDPAAVIIGSVLEEHLRTLAKGRNLPVEIILEDGSSRSKKASQLNDDLKKAEVYTHIDHKQVIAWLGIRNDAAHGKYSEYTKEQIDVMYVGVLNFLSRTS